MASNRANDGLDASNTTDAQYGSTGSTGRSNPTNRATDGLDPSGTTDLTNDRGGGAFANRTTDGLDASGTSDAQGGYSGSSGNYRTTDGLDPSASADASGVGVGDRRETNERRDDVGGTSGGLGYDDTIGSQQRTGGGQRGGDQETSQHTSGGLGENDTYGDQGDTGGNDTGYDHNFGMGTGRTVSQEEGGPLPTEAGRVDHTRGGDDFDPRPGEDEVQYEPQPPESKPQPTYNNGNGNGAGYDGDNSSKSKDSTIGKLMEKAGSMFKSDGLREKGEEKRRQAAGGPVGGENY